MPSALEIPRETPSGLSATDDGQSDEALPQPAVKPRFQARKKRRLGLWLSLAGLVLLGGGGVAYKLRSIPVTTTPIVRGTAVEAAYATGIVEPFDRVIVKAKVAGAVDLKVREGAKVKKGDLVAVIDSPTLGHDVERGKADLWAAQAQADINGPQFKKLEAEAAGIKAELNTAQNDKEHTAKLVATGSVPQIQLDHENDRITELQARLAANLAQQRALRIDLAARQQAQSAIMGSYEARLADTEVHAPIDGVLLARFVEPGEVAQVNTPLVKIGDASNLILECAIDEADIGHVTEGKKVAISLYAFSETVYEGEIFEIPPDADRAKKAFLAKVRIKNAPAGLRSGMTAEVNVIIQERPGSLLVPAEAVDSAGRVLVVADGHVQPRFPKLGVRDMLRVEVLDGLAEGDQVIVAGGEGLREGTRVSTTEKAPEAGLKQPSSSASRATL